MTSLLIALVLLAVVFAGIDIYRRYEPKIISKFTETKPINAQEAHTNWRKAKRDLTRAQEKEWSTKFNNLTKNGNRDYYDHVRVGAEKVNLRNSPSIFSGSYGALWPGAVVKVLETKSGTDVADNDKWYRVEIGGMDTKYIWSGAVDEYLPAKNKLSIGTKTNERKKSQRTIQRNH